MKSLITVGTGLLLGIVLTGVLPGCGEDDGGFKPEPVILSPSSPNNVLNNLVVCYKTRDIDRYDDVFHEDFTFRFTQYDIQYSHPFFPEGGAWGISHELETAAFVFDRYDAPADTVYSIESIVMTLSPSGASIPCNLVGAPPGTIEKTAYLRLKVTHKKPEETLYVLSRPLFYFVPDNPDTAKTWKIWMIEDDEPDIAALKLSDPGDGPTTVPVNRVSWGWLKVLHWSYMRRH